MHLLLAALVLAATLPSLPHSADLYVSGFFSSSVQRYYGPRSAVQGTPRPSPSQGGALYTNRGFARRPWGLAFGPSGELFVANATGNGGNILRFPRGGWPYPSRIRRTAVFATYPAFNPLYLAVGPDHRLYVSQSGGSGSDGNILRFDETSGALIDVFVPDVEGGPRGIAFAPGAR